MPAVMASTLSCDMSLGIEMLFEKSGTLVEIMSARKRAMVSASLNGRSHEGALTFVSRLGAALEAVGWLAEGLLV